MGYRTTVLLPIHQIATYDKHDQFVRIIGLPKEAGINEYIQIAKAIHELDPFDAMASFTENAEEFAGEVALVLGLEVPFTGLSGAYSQQVPHARAPSPHWVLTTRNLP